MEETQKHISSMGVAPTSRFKRYFSWGSLALVAIIVLLPICYALVAPSESDRAWMARGASEQRLSSIEADAAQERLDSAQRLIGLGKDWKAERATLDEILSQIASFQ